MKAAVLWALHDHPLLQPRGEMDTAAYVALAAHPTSLPFFVSPLYLYFLRLCGLSLLAARIVQIILGSVAVVLIFDMARRWTVDVPPAGGRDVRRRTGKERTERTDRPHLAPGAGPLPDIAAVLAILTGVITFYEITILQAALDPFLIALTLWCLTVALESDRPAAFAGAGVALALFVLNRPNALLWVPVLVIAIAFVKKRPDVGATKETATRWRGAVILAACFAVTIAPVTIRNYVVSHQLVLIASHGGLNFFIGNNAQADGTYHHVEGIRPTIAGQEEDAPRVAAAAMHARSVTPDEASSFFYREAWRWIRSHPAAATALFLRKIAYTFNQTDLALNYSYAYFTHDVSSALELLVVGPWLLFPLGLAGAVRSALEGRHTMKGNAFVIWALFIPLYAVAVALFFVSSRYRLPLLIPMCVTAPAMFRRPLRVPYWIAAIVLAVGVCWNFGLDDGRAHERTNMIVYLVEQNRFDEAMSLVESTAGMTRDPATLYLRSLEAFEQAGEHERAAQLAGRIDPAQLAPAQAKALAERARVTGMSAVQSNEPQKALAAFTTAHRLDPTDARDLLNIAVLQAQLGDFPSARANARAALQLRPGYAQAEGLLKAIEGK